MTRLVGVWLITGEGRPRKFTLRSTFIVQAVEKSDKPEFTARITGKEGHLFYPMLAIDSEPWFPQFKRKQGNFAFGFQPINDTTVKSGLLALLRATLAAAK